MMPPPSTLLLEAILRTVVRRYRLPPMDVVPAVRIRAVEPPVALPILIEQARRALGGGEPPDDVLRQRFLEALARLIRDAMRPDAGDPAFQAMVLRHRVVIVREYASLSAHERTDRRRAFSHVNAVAHPGRRRDLVDTIRCEALARLHAAATAGAWGLVFDIAHHLLEAIPVDEASELVGGLVRLRDSPELARLRRLDALASDDRVLRYQALRERHGPRSGSAGAVARGAASKRRGVEVEIAAARVLAAMATRLDHADGEPGSYRVATALRVPASILAGRERAKAEWDVVLLRRADAASQSACWDACLLLEAKASVEAATTDLPRLRRGLAMLADVDEDGVHTFAAADGPLRVTGASLRALPALYCSDAPAETNPRLLGAASRMQLLSAPASLAFASTLAVAGDADLADLEPVWHELLHSARWKAVLHQYPMLHEVRELMVQVDDLRAAIGDEAEGEAAVVSTRA